MLKENESTDHYRLLSTPVRENCLMLTALSRYAHSAAGKKLVGDVPFRLARSLMQQRKALHYENTQENLFCMQAFIDYAREFEQVPPNFKVTASLGGKPFGSGTFTKIVDPMKTFERPLQSTDPGTKTEVVIARQGAGRLYYAARVSFAEKEDKARDINAGIQVSRSYFVVRPKGEEPLNFPAQLKKGDVVRVKVKVNAPAARTYVVVSDPIPGGFEPVQANLATTSMIDAGGSSESEEGSGYMEDDYYGGNAFYFKEIRHDFARFYSEHYSGEPVVLEYSMQAIASGTFMAEPTHAEEMYDPDVFGKAKAARFMIKD